MKYISIALLALLLAGCQGQPNLISKQYVGIQIPSDFYTCPAIKNYPNYKTLTDSQVAKILVDMERNIEKCRNSLNAIRTYMKEANVVIKK